jgi:hypothetical protein
MTLPRLDFLTPVELAQIAADVASLVTDPQLTKPVTYRNFQSITFTPSTGMQVPSFTDSSLRVIRNNVTTRDVAIANGLYQMGDVLFTFDRATFSAITPNREDLIVDEGETWKVVSWETDPIQKLWRIVARLMT